MQRALIALHYTLTYSPTLFLCFVRRFYLAWYLLVHLFVRMVYKRAYEGFGHIAVEVYLVPMLLVPMPRSFDAVVAIAQLQCIVGLALQHHEVGSFQVEAGEYLTHETEHKGGLVEGECLIGIRLLQAIFADVFDVHGAEVCSKSTAKTLFVQSVWRKFRKIEYE